MVYVFCWTRYHIIVPIYKKGSREDPSNYRGITLTSAMSKLFTHSLINSFLFV